MAQMTREQVLKHYRDNSPKDLIALYEGLKEKLYSYADISRDSMTMYSPEMIGMVKDFVMESCQGLVESVDYGNETQLMESYDENVDGTIMPLNQVHESNLAQLLENSATEVRSANANQLNLNQLTPFDAFLPFTIIRSYLPLIGKDLIPTQTPPKPFIRIKEMYKYIVTKDNKKYLRPDIYNDTSKAKEILDTAKGARVTEKWYPAETEDVGGSDPNGVTLDDSGKKYILPTKLEVKGLDVLAESGGLLQIGDALDIDVCVDSIRAIVEATDGTKTVVEQSGYKAFPDLTSITPQRSISFKVKLPVKNSEGEVESIVYDTVYGDFDAATNKINLVSMYGYVRQVQLNGHLSNKNSYEYLSFTHEYDLVQHPIPEGYKSNVPITNEDMQLFNETGSIDIIATAVNEMTEIFTQLEDNSIVAKVDEEFARWQGKGEDEHPFKHMFGPVVFEKSVDVKHDSTRLLKRYEVVQDEINYALRGFIGDMRNTLKAEPFRLVAFCHPNIASLFVGNNVDWKVTPGTNALEGIRTDYKMGIFTSNGDSFRIITSQKIAEADGVRFLLYPVNEQNFLSWKHFKYSMYFDRDHRNPQMHLVPAISGYSRFYTHSYTPLQAKLLIENY